MVYEIMTLAGDFPMPGQTNWGVKFSKFAEAKAAARVQQATLSSNSNGVKYTSVYTVVMDEYAETVFFAIRNGKEYAGLRAQALADSMILGD
jgi:hypothetical protein